jgi:hypothetical protein
MVAESLAVNLMVGIMSDDNLVFEVILESLVKMLYIVGFYEYTLLCDEEVIGITDTIDVNILLRESWRIRVSV